MLDNKPFCVYVLSFLHNRCLRLELLDHGKDLSNSIKKLQTTIFSSMLSTPSLFHTHQYLSSFLSLVILVSIHLYLNLENLDFILNLGSLLERLRLKYNLSSGDQDLPEHCRDTLSQLINTVNKYNYWWSHLDLLVPLGCTFSCCKFQASLGWNKTLSQK